MSKKFSQTDFLNNLEYILINLENDKEKANSLENKMYFELSKDELIISEYKMIEPIISELELCLADLENIFHMNGISYSLFQIGKILSNIKKEYDENGR